MTNGIKPSVLCLLVGLGTSVQAAHPAEIKLSLTQLTGKQCLGALENSNTIIPGDCITYRIEVKNIGELTANDVQISALIPAHTELHTTFRKIENQQPMGSIIETKVSGQRIIKTTLDTLQANDTNGVILEYSVRIL